MEGNTNMKTPIAKYQFKNNGETFSAYYAAIIWCRDNGYSYGSNCRAQPTAMFKGDHDIAKWYNLSKKEQNSVDGVMQGDFREGDIEILIYK